MKIGRFCDFIWIKHFKFVQKENSFVYAILLCVSFIYTAAMEEWMREEENFNLYCDFVCYCALNFAFYSCEKLISITLLCCTEIHVIFFTSFWCLCLIIDKCF